MNVPVSALKSSPSRCEMPPVPEDAYEYLPGFFLSSAMNSFMSFTGTFFGFTVMTLGTFTRLMIGVKSFAGS
jgi:hypothetical protein